MSASSAEVLLLRSIAGAAHKYLSELCKVPWMPKMLCLAANQCAI